MEQQLLDYLSGMEVRIVDSIKAEVAEMEEMESRITERMGEFEGRIVALLATIEALLGDR